MKGLKPSSPALLQSVLAASQNGVLVFKTVWKQGILTDLRITMINSVAERELGQPAVELMGMSFKAINSVLIQSDLLDECRQVIQTRQSRQYELTDTQSGYVVDYKVSVDRAEDYMIVSYTSTHPHAGSAWRGTIFEKAFEASVNGISVFEAIQEANGQVADFRLVMINDAGVRMSGSTRQELIGQTLWQLYPATHINGLFTRFVQVYTTGELYTGEHYYPEYNIWREVNVVRVADGIMTTYLDITDRKNADEAARKQSLLLRTTSNSTPAGLVLWEAVRDQSPEHRIVNFRYQMTNVMNTLVTGYSSEELVGRLFLDMFPRFRGTTLEMVLREVVETGKTMRMIFTDYTDRPEGWYDAQFSRVGDGVLMTYMDVTEQHKAQLDLKQKSDLIQAVINAQQSGIILYKPVYEQSIETNTQHVVDFTVVLANETAQRVIGRSVDQIIGQRQTSLFPESLLQPYRALQLEVLRSGQAKEWVQYYSNEFITGWYQTTIRPHDGQLLITFSDVSDMKRQQQALEAKNTELRRSNDNLQQFAYVASHDLQEPLRKIQSFGDLLATNHGPMLDQEAQGMISRMQTAAVRMSTLIRDLLQYSRVSTHRAPAERIPLSTLLDEVLDDLQVPIQLTGAVIHRNELPHLHGDKRQLRQLFQNLLSNALKFQADGITPQVTISARTISAGELSPLLAVQLPLGPEGNTGIQRNFQEISVADNGIGFDEKYLDRIFQVFQRLHNKTAYPGTGVGLSICRKVAENHQGILTAVSQPGQGATFILYLPLPD